MVRDNDVHNDSQPEPREKMIPAPQPKEHSNAGYADCYGDAPRNPLYCVPTDRAIVLYAANNQCYCRKREDG